MSRRYEDAIIDSQKSQFILSEDNTLEVRDAVMLFPNFRGEMDRFRNSARNFNIAVPANVKGMFEDLGVKVREKVVEGLVDDAGNPAILYLVNIKVNFDSNWPPTVTLYSKFRGKKSHTRLDADSVGELDSIYIESMDFTCRPYRSKQFPDKATLYAQDIRVIQEESLAFGGKFDDWMDDDSNPFEE